MSVTAVIKLRMFIMWDVDGSTFPTYAASLGAAKVWMVEEFGCNFLEVRGRVATDDDLQAIDLGVPAWYGIFDEWWED